jgi:hypothetical protein
MVAAMKKKSLSLTMKETNTQDKCIKPVQL